jgi:hypothetical protein
MSLQEAGRFIAGWRVAALALAVLFSVFLLASARAQQVPAEPTPSESARAIAAQAARDPAGADASLADLFRRLASPRVVLPSWEDVQADRLRRDWTRPSGAGASLAAPEDVPAARACDFSGVDGLRRAHRESVDVTLSRPLPRVGLGAGWAETDVRAGGRDLRGDAAPHLFLSVDLARFVRPVRLLPPPLVEHVETTAAASVVHVDDDEYAVDSLKLPKN